LEVQATQVPLLDPDESGRQCGVVGLLAQSESVPPSLCGSHVVAAGCTQVCETLQVSPVEQSRSEMHSTHCPLVEHFPVGALQSASEPQPALLTHM
jgi:hypothetical protein